MKLMIIVCAVACLALAAGTFVDEDFTLVDEQQTSSPAVDGGEMTDIVMAEELTTKKARVTTTTTTTSLPKIELVDEVEATPAPANKTRKTSNRPRTSGSRRKQSSKAKTVVDAVQEEDIPKAEMTSPASVDTASALAPKNFKPTPKPLEEFQQTQGLMEFLKKRKFERIQASTTEDPFVAILATATMPSTEESVSPASESAPIRSSGGSARRLPTTNRRFSASARATTAATTTTTTPATEAPTVAAAVTTKRPNRFGALRNSKALGTTATTTAQPVTEQPKAAESTRSKLFPKRPVNLRPVANSISRRKDQATTASPTTPAAAVEEDVIIPIPEEIQVIVEPTTATPLRRTRGRIAPRVSGL